MVLLWCVIVVLRRTTLIVLELGISGFLLQGWRVLAQVQTQFIVWRMYIVGTVLYGIGSQSGVRGPPGVLEGVPGGPQLNDS